MGYRNVWGCSHRVRTDGSCRRLLRSVAFALRTHPTRLGNVGRSQRWRSELGCHTSCRQSYAGVGSCVLFSELADFAVYTPLQVGWLRAVVASNIVGAVVDSALFLWLAFGTLDFITGQVVGKLYMTAAAIVVIECGVLVLVPKPLPSLGDLGGHPNVGQLVQPRSSWTPDGSVSWAADNDAFNEFHPTRFRAMLERLQGISGCLWVACPDVVADFRSTLNLFYEWHGEIRRPGFRWRSYFKTGQHPASPLGFRGRRIRRGLTQ